MVTGFENITHPLTDDEVIIAQEVVDVWKAKKPALFDAEGDLLNPQDKPVIKFAKMLRGLNETTIPKLKESKLIGDKYKKLSGPRLRQIIHLIRAHDMVSNLIATSKGYFKTVDPELIQKFIKSNYERSNAFIETAQAFEKQLIRHQNGKARNLC